MLLTTTTIGACHHIFAAGPLVHRVLCRSLAHALLSGGMDLRGFTSRSGSATARGGTAGSVAVSSVAPLTARESRAAPTQNILGSVDRTSGLHSSRNFPDGGESSSSAASALGGRFGQASTTPRHNDSQQPMSKMEFERARKHKEFEHKHQKLEEQRKEDAAYIKEKYARHLRQRDQRCEDMLRNVLSEDGMRGEVNQVVGDHDEKMKRKKEEMYSKWDSEVAQRIEYHVLKYMQPKPPTRAQLLEGVECSSSATGSQCNSSLTGLAYDGAALALICLTASGCDGSSRSSDAAVSTASQVQQAAAEKAGQVRLEAKEGGQGHVRVIHQQFRSNDPASWPPEWRSLSQAWRDRHPDWEWRFWSDEDEAIMFREQLPEFQTLYELIPTCRHAPISRADLATYAILYLHGGLYADMDTAPLTNLDAVIEAAASEAAKRRQSTAAAAPAPPLDEVRGLGGLEQPYSTDTDLMIATAPGHRFFYEVLRSIQDFIAVHNHTLCETLQKTATYDIMFLTAWGRLSMCARAWTRNGMDYDGLHFLESLYLRDREDASYFHLVMHGLATSSLKDQVLLFSYFGLFETSPFLVSFCCYSCCLQWEHNRVSVVIRVVYTCCCCCCCCC
ncbi:unnamed protein product [Polarella glacialis]|uniref:Uncharacterized protein n=1 Tax=Polarella glacialis TaxID=89957 RepID=A0A813L8U9_POLGL|nr:unnamed protein product [Polarella glacialis]